MPQIVASNTTYEACVKGKQHWTPFPEIGKWRETEILILGLVHADLFKYGPISRAWSGQKKYLLCFINDFSRKP